jgi:hypothetical protein
LTATIFDPKKESEISMGKSLAVKNEIIAGLKQTLSELKLQRDLTTRA